MKSVGIKILVVILVIVIAIAAALLALKVVKDRNSIQTNTGEEYVNKEPTVVEIKEPETFKGTERPIAVMIDNNTKALPHAGLNDAYLVYEMIVEGGETRLMALFKGKDLSKIGPVRSSRHYFLDYALENDAIYVHFGWSPQAQSDIRKLGVDNINGIYESSTTFWRARDKYAPHNAVTSTEQILKVAQRENYRLTSDIESVLNYVADPVELESEILANTVTIPYSYYNTVKYEYDEETKTYLRYTRGIQEVDWDTDEAVTVKNIIVTFCENWTLNDGENKGRQTLDNVKTLDGYYITNGKAIKITCEKSTRSGQTVYKDLAGNEIEVNDGNTFIQICPIASKVTFEPGIIEPEPEVVTNIVE